MLIASAIRYRGVVYLGRRHHMCIRTINSIFDFNTTADSGGFREQGFIDEKGNYYDRKRAGIYAIKCGQIKELKYHKTDLFSEDLW